MCQGGPGGGVLNKLVTAVDRCPQKATNRMTPALQGPRALTVPQFPLGGGCGFTSRQMHILEIIRSVSAAAQGPEGSTVSMPFDLRHPATKPAAPMSST
ncbi:uncharacterized protein AKAME5_000924200 [Lates japonicus]|uniref:Uncharacterized protein n=1 Tax=Lates japonicus TaxID=270547 RepID=A0AAD3MNY9_LATJO|nr:uncharacterized protein AKAME5_000924200 [Lates japonicus]